MIFAEAGEATLNGASLAAQLGRRLSLVEPHFAQPLLARVAEEDRVLFFATALVECCILAEADLLMAVDGYPRLSDLDPSSLLALR